MTSEAVELDDAEFGGTFAHPMTPVVDSPIGPAASACARGILRSRGGNQEFRLELSSTYASGDRPYVHFLFWYGVPNVYLVIVASQEIGVTGYHRLDLNEKYGLPSPKDDVWWPQES